MPDVNDALGFVERQLPEEHGIYDREDRAVCADTQRQARDGRDGEASVSAEAATGLTEFLYEPAHEEWHDGTVERVTE